MRRRNFSFAMWMLGASIAQLVLGACGSNAESGPGGTGGTGGGGGSPGSGGSVVAGGGAGPMGGAGPAGGAIGQGGAAGVTMSPRAACRAYVRGFCERNVRCGGPSDVDHCLLEYAASCPDLFFSPGSNRTVEGLASCADQYRNLPCNPYLAPPCAVGGTRRDGETCLFGSQCASTLCSASSFMPTSCGVCQPVVAPGAACTPDVTHCPSGQSCTGGVCADVPNTNTPPVTLPGAGQPCAQTCVAGYACLNDAAGSGQRCLALMPIGQGCLAGQCDATGYCGPSASADLKGVCVALPKAHEPCSQGSGCAPGTYCPAGSGSPLCVKRQAAGSPCGSVATKECLEGLSCVTGSGTRPLDQLAFSGICAHVAEEGESCTDPAARCAYETKCTGGACAPTGNAGLFEAVCGH